MVPVNRPTWSIRELVATLALPSSNSRSDGVRHDPRPGLTGHRLHDFGEAGDDRCATRGHEAHAGRHLGAHGARLEVAFGGVGLHLGEGHGAERPLFGGVVVDVGLGHVGEDEERVGGHILGEQGGGEVLVDDRVDAREGAALLAKEVAADELLILTDVPQAYIHYKTPEQQALATVTLAEMQAFAAEGHFKAGSMGPKVAACMRFVEAGGTAVIGSLTEVVQAMAGEAGTRIVPEAGTGKKLERPAGHAAKKSAGKTHAKKADSKKAPAK